MSPNHKALCEALDAAAPDWRELSYPDEADMLTNAARAIRALIAERDAAMAWFRAVEKTGSALCQTFDLATPAEEALRDVLTTACSLAEFEAFRAGAEAMREAMRIESRKRERMAADSEFDDWAIARCQIWGQVISCLSALPLPAPPQETKG